MRRAPALSLLLAAALLAPGCASAPQTAKPAEHRNGVSLAGGDRIGRMIVRDTPDFDVAAAHAEADLATVDTDAPAR